MTEEKFTRSERYKINGKHLYHNNEWRGCPSSLQLALLIGLMCEPEPVYLEQRRLLPLSLLVKPV